MAKAAVNRLRFIGHARPSMTRLHAARPLKCIAAPHDRCRTIRRHCLRSIEQRRTTAPTIARSYICIFARGRFASTIDLDVINHLALRIVLHESPALFCDAARRYGVYRHPFHGAGKFCEISLELGTHYRCPRAVNTDVQSGIRVHGPCSIHW